MAPQKRLRDEVDEDDSNMTLECANPQPERDENAHRRKRVSIDPVTSQSRHVHRRQNSSSASKSSSEQPDAHGKVLNPAVPPATQYEILRDGNFEELQNPDLDDQRASQRWMARRKEPGQIGENHAADNAIVEEIRCLNFMCHINMHVQLGPLINFLVGENGSGKSAILTALSLCLGGKASATNRGGSLKSFIKTGEDMATLSVRLKNQGLSAYQPDLFGQSIIIERHFSNTGSSGFKLKNHAGRVISNKKGDIDDVLEYFQLQVDNPMNILTQDNAKTFITNSSPTMKYQFFYKGTQLETLDHDYQMVHESINNSEAKIFAMEESIKDLETSAVAAREKAKVVEQHAAMRSEIGNLRNQVAWSQIEDQEGIVRMHEHEVKLIREKLAAAEQRMKLKAQELENTNTMLERYTETEMGLRQDLEPLQAELEEAQASYGNGESELRHLRSQQRSIASEIKTATKKAKDFQAEIKNEEKRIADVLGGLPTTKLAEIEQARQRVESTQRELEDCAQSASEQKAQLDESIKASREAATPMALVQKDWDTARRTLADLRSNRPDPLGGYDNTMRKLLQIIRADRNFQEAPVGPIGLHIKLKKQQWSHVLEKFFGQVLNSFIVTSKADQSRLSSIMRGLNMNFCPIVIGKKQPLDTSLTQPDPQYETILRVLDIDNDLVRNQLIIVQSIEQSLLVEDREEAHNIMFSGPKPINVRQCLALNSNRLGCGFRLSYSGRNGKNTVTEPVLGNAHRKPRMKSDIESRIAFQTILLEDYQRELHNAEHRCETLQSEEQEYKSALAARRRELESLKINSQKAEAELESLEAEYQAISVEDGRLDALKRQLKDAQDEIALHEGSYDAASEHISGAKGIVEQRQRVVDDAKARITEQESRLLKVRRKVKTAEQARTIALQEKNIAFNAFDEVQGALAQSQRVLDEQAAELSDWTEQATEVSPRVPVTTGMTTARLQAKLKSLTGNVREYNARLGGTDQEILAAATEAIQAWQRAEESQENLNRLNRLLKQSLMKRLVQYKAFRRYISSNARMQFNYLLSERGFRGKMNIDHRTRILDVTVEPDETMKSDRGRGTKTLSGGEKSFSSICLLLSVWEAMGAPMRCLDEFDVFMDDINRDVSTNLIIKGARRSVGRQFILISPKSISGGATEGHQPDVRIHKLIHPREQQRRLDEMLA